MMKRTLSERLVQASEDIQKLKTSQILSGNSYRVYEYSGSFSADVQYGAGGSIKFKGNEPFPLVCLQSLKFYINGTLVNFVDADFSATDGGWFYTNSNDETFQVALPLPTGEQDPNEWEAEIWVLLDNGSSSVKVTMRIDYTIRTSVEGKVTTELGSY